MPRLRLVILFAGVFCSLALFAHPFSSISDYQGTWSRVASDHGLSRIKVFHLYDKWIMQIYEHCQNYQDCMIAQVPLKPGIDPNQQLQALTANWQQETPSSNHLILLYYLSMTPQDDNHLKWSIIVRMGGSQTGRKLMTMQGILNRDDAEHEEGVTLQHDDEAKAADDSSQTEQPKQCVPLHLQCVLSHDPSTMVGEVMLDQQIIVDGKTERCMPFQLKHYDAKNLSMLFELNKMSCVQNFPKQCSNDQCTAIIKNSSNLGKLLAFL